ncbi:YggT family protein [Convivina intestini]|uniref:YggT family protein n=1 Tax=Convivina intestini TaxID=1505726 RepID=A0A2U1D908_9LACO|nr:YggT family protein [Convivina intestini]PVY84160.1 YggT family protein [Convivina intestini]CAH1854357.1 hypothetical protein R077811_00884 [Convivina intestini]SDB91169.1 YggT family protein [Leuconostocaceae bacterium R-53105]
MALFLSIVSYFIQFYSFLIVVFALMSWLPGAANSWLGREISRVVVPYLRLFRFIPTVASIDFSPIIALLVLQFVMKLLSNLL